jgi:hypothetical protein
MKTVHQITITIEVTEKDYKGFRDCDEDIISQVTEGIDFYAIIQQKIEEEADGIGPDDFEGFRITVEGDEFQRDFVRSE